MKYSSKNKTKKTNHTSFPKNKIVFYRMRPLVCVSNRHFCVNSKKINVDNLFNGQLNRFENKRWMFSYKWHSTIDLKIICNIAIPSVNYHM